MPLDLSDLVLDPDLTDDIIYRNKYGQDIDIKGIVRETFEAGSESGKGLSSPIRYNNATFARFTVAKKDFTDPIFATKEYMIVGEKNFMIMTVMDKHNGLLEFATKEKSTYRGAVRGVAEI